MLVDIIIMVPLGVCPVCKRKIDKVRVLRRGNKDYVYVVHRNGKEPDDYCYILPYDKLLLLNGMYVLRYVDKILYKDIMLNMLNYIEADDIFSFDDIAVKLLEILEKKAGADKEKLKEILNKKFFSQF